MAISKQRRVLPLGSLFQNEPHLRRHTLTLARNAHFNWSEAVAINGGLGLIDQQAYAITAGIWPDDGLFLARTERPDFGGTTAPWIFQVQARFCSVWITFPDLALGPFEVMSYSSSWSFGAVEVDIPIGAWHKFVLYFEDVEGGAEMAWATWGERPLTATDLVPASTAPASLVAPVIYGTGLVGEVLTCSPGTWSGFPAPTFAYQWYKAPSTLIVGADTFQYTPLIGDVGADVYCEVTATNGSGSASADSNQIEITAGGVSNALITSDGDTFVTSDGDTIVWA